MPPPEIPLSTAALSVIDAVEQHARRHPRAGRPGLVLLLARQYCPWMLRRKWKRDA